MTICVAVKVNECMVFASDSASSFNLPDAVDEMGDPIQQVYRHGNKVFQLHHELPIMAMTSGLGNFGTKSIASLAKEFRHKISNDELGLKTDYNMKDVAEIAHKFFVEDAFNKAFEKPEDIKGVFELSIGGYGADSDLPELWRIMIIDGVASHPKLVADQTKIGVWPSGQPDPIMRLVNGFGFKLEEVLRRHGITPETHADLYKEVAPSLFLPLVNSNMPIQDAIDLAEFLADMTKKVFRFRAVPEYVSGDIDLAVITKYEKFKWIKRKHFYPIELNNTGR